LAGVVAFCAWADVASWSARPSISSAKILIVSLRRFVQLQRVELLPDSRRRHVKRRKDLSLIEQDDHL
jgi:hypothetical protein